MMTSRTSELRLAHVWPRLSVRGIIERLVAADALHRQHHVLKTLDDRMLRDIGVTRAEVSAELDRPMLG